MADRVSRLRARRSGRVIVGLLLLAGSAPVSESADQSQAAWETEVAGHGVDPSAAVYVFAATEEMVDWVNARVKSDRTSGDLERLEALQRALFDRSDFNFEYAEALTLPAAGAFARRQGNCMAFTSLFVALARSIGVPTLLVSVKTEPDIVRSDGLVIVNRHVVAGYRGVDGFHLFDFYSTSSGPYLESRVISDVTASAMYHSNIGGAALRAGDLDEARTNLELATRLAPGWAPAWVNLGVVLNRQGLDDEAMNAYGRALEVEPSNQSAFNNMAGIYRKRGDFDAERNALAAAVSVTRSPFTLIAMAEIQMNRGEEAHARSLLRRARWWYPKEPEVYDALARLADREGAPKRAERYRRKAADLRVAAME